MILRLRTRCIYCGPGIWSGHECLIAASYTRGTDPSAWYKGQLVRIPSIIVIGPPSAFMVIEPIPTIRSKS